MPPVVAGSGRCLTSRQHSASPGIFQLWEPPSPRQEIPGAAGLSPGLRMGWAQAPIHHLRQAPGTGSQGKQEPLAGPSKAGMEARSLPSLPVLTLSLRGAPPPPSFSLLLQVRRLNAALHRHTLLTASMNQPAETTWHPALAQTPRVARVGLDAPAGPVSSGRGRSHRTSMVAGSTLRSSRELRAMTPYFHNPLTVFLFVVKFS